MEDATLGSSGVHTSKSLQYKNVFNRSLGKQALFIWKMLVLIGLMNYHGKKVNLCTAKCNICRRLDPLGVVSLT